MTSVLIISGVLLLLSWAVNGFNLIAITALLSTALFCGRKVGYFCKLNTLFVIEGIGIALTIVLRILFRNFVLVEIIPVIVLRLIFICYCIYEKENYVYVKEEKRKGLDE